MKQLSPLKDPTNPKKPLFLETTACFLQAFYIYFNKRFFKCCVNTQLKTNAMRIKSHHGYKNLQALKIQ
ncbi:hypothetical protein JT180_05645 [Helicobacter pylori]|nr:hypothetical protein [Helicobacter pylori]